MHILIVPSWYSSKRNPVLGSFFKEQAIALSKYGHKVTIAYNEVWPLTLVGKVFEKPGISSQIEDGVKTYRYKNFNFLPKNPLMFKIFDKRMEKLYEKIEKTEGKPDVIHAHSCLWAGISARHISKKYNIPLVITEHSSLKNSVYLKENYLPHIVKAYNEADKVVAVGNGLKEELSQYVKNNQIDIIPNMVDLERFYPKNYKCDNKFSFFSLAFLDHFKGMDVLIKAFEKAFKNKKVELIIGGAGPAREELEKLTEDLGLEKQIRFLGAVSREEASEEMNKCNAFALASRHETFGVVYIEALACGKPIIGTRNGGAEDIINETNGLLVDIDDVNGLSQAMLKVRTNYDNYSSTLIREDCINRYSEASIVEKLNNVYEGIL